MAATTARQSDMDPYKNRRDSGARRKVFWFVTVGLLLGVAFLSARATLYYDCAAGVQDMKEALSRAERALDSPVGVAVHQGQYDRATSAVRAVDSVDSRLSRYCHESLSSGFNERKWRVYRAWAEIPDLVPRRPDSPVAVN